MNKTFVIAEAGANHDRKKTQAYALIDEAIKAKATAVKFQTYSSETLYSKYTPDFEYKVSDEYVWNLTAVAFAFMASSIDKKMHY